MIAYALFSLFITIVALIAATTAARRPKSATAGVAIGTTVGLLIGVGLPAIVSFFGYVIPYGQLRFCFWTEYHDVFG